MKKILGIIVVSGGFLMASSPQSSASMTIENCQKPLRVELSKTQSMTNLVAREAEKSRLNFYLGRCAFLEKATDLSVPFFEQGEKNAETALELKSDEPVALFWWVANAGTLADISRSIGALRTVKIIAEKLILISEKEPDYGFSGAYRVLGKIYEKAPRFISIGSSTKAEQYLKKAYERFPKFPGNIIALAEFYDSDDRIDEAKKILMPLVESQQIQEGDFGAFNVEKQEWLQLVNGLTKKWSDKK